jgi:predicted nuclease of predicted toxin-antitoxin system
MRLRILVDECVQAAIATALADAGHDLEFVAVGRTGWDDRAVAALAITEGRLVLTQDYNFGELAVRHGLELPGVLLVACDALRPEDRAAHVLAALAKTEGPFEGFLTIVEPKRTRRRALR